MHPVPGYGWRRSAHSNRWQALQSLDQEFNLKLETGWEESGKTRQAREQKIVKSFCDNIRFQGL
jgi:hypothetical protein